MKKVVLATILLLSCLSISCSQEDYTNKSDREKRKGYKEANIYLYGYKSGEIDKESKRLLATEKYDEEGNLITDIGKYDKAVYRYNDKGLLIEKQFFRIDNDEEPLRFVKYKYNDKGLLIEEIEHNKEGEPTTIIIYEYN